MLQISLAAARVNANLKQEQAAKLIGVTAKTLRNYEQGVTVIPAPKLIKASEVYRVPVDMIKIPIINDNEYDEPEFFLQPTTV